MAITPERFAQGLPLPDYLSQMTRNRERFEANLQAALIPNATRQFFSQLPQPLPVVVLTEDWCESAIAHLPALARLAAESGRLELRFFLRDQNRDVMNHYLKDDQFAAIPTCVFFDQEFRELGRWVEAPAKIEQLMSAMRADFRAADPALATIPPDTPFQQLPEAVQQRVVQALMEFRRQHQALAAAEVVREIHTLLEDRLGTQPPALGDQGSLPA